MLRNYKVQVKKSGKWKTVTECWDKKIAKLFRSVNKKKGSETRYVSKKV